MVFREKVPRILCVLHDTNIHILSPVLFSFTCGSCVWAGNICDPGTSGLVAIQKSECFCGFWWSHKSHKVWSLDIKMPENIDRLCFWKRYFYFKPLLFCPPFYMEMWFSNNGSLGMSFYTPHNEVVRGVYWFHSVRPSACPSVRPASHVCSVVPTVLVGSIS